MKAFLVLTLLVARLAPAATAPNGDGYYGKASWLEAVHQFYPNSQIVALDLSDGRFHFPLMNVEIFDAEGGRHSLGAAPIDASGGVEINLSKYDEADFTYSEPVQAFGAFFNLPYVVSGYGIPNEAYTVPDVNHLQPISGDYGFEGFWGVIGGYPLVVYPGGILQVHPGYGQFGTLYDVEFVIASPEPKLFFLLPLGLLCFAALRLYRA